MASEKLDKFLDALKAVRNDWTCGVCAELCRNPVTLSKCFHIICSEHFEDLVSCPTCHIALEGCKVYVDKTMESSIASVKALEDMFKECKPSETLVEKQTVLQDKNVNSDADDSFIEETDETKGKKLTASKKNKIKEQKVPASKKKSTKITLSVEKENLKSKVDSNQLLKNSNENLSTKKTLSVEKENLKSKVDSNKLLKNSNENLSHASSSKFDKVLEKKNTKGETALHVACRLGKLDKVSELLHKGANANTKDNAGWTPLHEAVQNGRGDIVKLLLQYHALINVPGPSNETPLHEALRYGHIKIVEELVKNGADTNSKNCKGESPEDLAVGEMKDVMHKAAEHIVQTQSLNITIMSTMYAELDYENVRVFCTSQFRTVMSKLKLLTKNHDIHIEPKLTPKVTHLVIDTEDGVCTPSLEILQGIVNNKWIISSEWVINSSEDKLEPFEQYEVVGVGIKTYNGPKNARYNKYKQLPGIFNGCHFYLHNFTKPYEISKTMVLTKATSTKLITDAGGIVLRRVPNPESIPESEKLVPYHANRDGKLVQCSHYIIFKDMYEPMYNMKHIKALPIGWLIECIEKYELCEPWSIGHD